MKLKIKAVFGVVVLLLLVVIYSVCYDINRLNRYVETLKTEKGDQLVQLNNAYISFSSAFELIREYEFLKLSNVVNSELKQVDIFPNIEERLIFYYPLSNCRLCFDQTLSMTGIIDAELMTILVYTTSKTDYLYFQKEYAKSTKHEIFWVNEPLFKDYYDLGIPILFEVNPDKAIKNPIYVLRDFPEIMKAYISSFNASNSTQ